MIEALRNRRAALRVLLASLVLIAALFVFVFPTSTFLAQRDKTSKARAQFELLQRQNAKLQHEAKRLQSDAEIEKLARERYGLVKPGETAYAIVPGEAPTTTTTAPPPTTAAPPAPSSPSRP